LVLHARGILARATSRVAGHYSSNWNHSEKT
jgi:hypothetical protein